MADAYYAEKKTKSPQNTTPRKYEEMAGFEMRTGKFYDPNEHLNGVKYEIRILHKDPELMQALHDKIVEILNT